MKTKKIMSQSYRQRTAIDRRATVFQYFTTGKRLHED
jgi:hypothetical protein